MPRGCSLPHVVSTAWSEYSSVVFVQRERISLRQDDRSRLFAISGFTLRQVRADSNSQHKGQCNSQGGVVIQWADNFLYSSELASFLVWWIVGCAKRLILIVSPRRRSGGSSGRAVSYQERAPRFESQSGPNQFFIATLCPPSTKLVARSLKTRQK
ncbi:hypothetical protein PoB_005932400 [Plakobranchus ocellatus]|uniref:Uncharacterized protein n=1 Tax=Plakobranchus ocellatus TaxID=259542 RepID=A0AAV4CN64_9GAST|nr:hypothetical protein PoB_005932400 [Plakobranchus ocellatus]